MNTQLQVWVLIVCLASSAVASPQRRRPDNPKRQALQPVATELDPNVYQAPAGHEGSAGTPSYQGAKASVVPQAAAGGPQTYQSNDAQAYHQALDSNYQPSFSSPGFQAASSSSASPSYQDFQGNQGFQGFQAFQGSRQGVPAHQAQQPAYNVGGGIQYSGLDDVKAPEFDGTSYYGTSQPHTFGYSVADAYHGNTHAHNEYSDGDTTQGEYRVLLPDGRTQVVKYSADSETGFMAKVTYEGEAKPYVPPKGGNHGGGHGGGGGKFKPRPAPSFASSGGGGAGAYSGGFGIGGPAGGGGGGGSFRQDQAPVYTSSGGAFKQ